MKKIQIILGLTLLVISVSVSAQVKLSQSPQIQSVANETLFVLLDQQDGTKNINLITWQNLKLDIVAEAKGTPGTDGSDGAVGPAGPAGPAGAVGPAGPAGPTGPAGADGADGDIGPAGATGAVGPAGATGPTGATGAAGSDGAGVPAGGTAGQILSKIDGTDFNTEWITGGGGSESTTVSDTAEIDLTLTGFDITADIVAGSIDVLKLDADVQTSLGLADGALQSFTEVDGSVTNEIQDLTLTSNTLALSGDATTVDLSPYLDNTDTTYVSSDFDHDQLTNFVASEHIDWSAASAGTVHATNYVDNDTIYDDTAIQAEVTANTAKVTNATHTGDVTGSGALTIAAGAVDIAMLSATGTPSTSTYLRGDNTWATGAGGGSDGNGIYDGNGTLGGNTTITVGTNLLTMAANNGYTFSFNQNTAKFNNSNSSIGVDNAGVGLTFGSGKHLTLDTNPGSAGQVLQSNGGGSAPTWETPSGGGTPFSLLKKIGTGTALMDATPTALAFATTQISAGSDLTATSSTVTTIDTDGIYEMGGKIFFLGNGQRAQMACRWSINGDTSQPWSGTGYVRVLGESWDYWTFGMPSEPFSLVDGDTVEIDCCTTEGASKFCASTASTSTVQLGESQMWIKRIN